MASQSSDAAPTVPVPIRRFVAGAMSGVITKCSIAPFELVQILHQIEGMKKEKGVSPKYTGFSQTITTVAKEEGVTALYKGNGANVLRVMPVYALKFGFNDVFKDIVRARSFTVPTDRSLLKPLSFGDSVGAGFMAAFCQISLTYPLEVMRSRLALSASSMLATKKYKGLLDCGMRVVQEEGVRGLYKGLSATYLSGIPFITIQLSSYSIMQDLVRDANGQTSVVAKLGCGASAGLLAQTLAFPGDTLRRRMQNDGIAGQEKKYRNVVHATQTILRQEGAGAFFNGLKANAMGALPANAIMFLAFETLKQVFGCES